MLSANDRGNRILGLVVGLLLGGGLYAFATGGQGMPFLLPGATVAFIFTGAFASGGKS